MSQPHVQQTADGRLAAAIVEALRAAGLIRAEDAAQVREKLAAGTARPADWEQWITSGEDQGGAGGGLGRTG